MRPKCKKYTEYSYPYVLSFVMCAIICLLTHYGIITEAILDNIFDKELFSQIITIESIVFGFLLTGLSLILQMDNPAINAIKKVGRYPDLISYCKSAVISSLVAVIVSLLAMILHPIKDLWYLTYPWWFFFLLSIFTLYRFVRIFFLLAKSAQ